MNVWTWVFALTYLYAGWAFGEVTFGIQPRRDTWARLVGYALLFVAWPLLMPWVPTYGMKRLRRKMGASK